jgi:DNA-binding FadR family transcriptional regulator
MKKASSTALELDALRPTPRAYEVVAHELLVLILAGHFARGDRLPSERHLAARFAVSRPTIRAALSALESRGMVVTRAGTGTFICDPADSDDDEHEESIPLDDSPVELMETRLSLEVAVARLAARRAPSNPEALENVRVAVESLECVANPAQFPSGVDIDFHRSVARLTGNGYLIDLLEPLWATMSQSLYQVVLRREWTIEHTRRAATDHRSVYEALRIGDPELAAFAMERHLRALLAVLFDDDGFAGPPPRFYA